MAKENVRWEAPVGKLLIQAYREEALLYEKEEKYQRALVLRRLADRLEISLKRTKHVA